MKSVQVTKPAAKTTKTAAVKATKPAAAKPAKATKPAAPVEKKARATRPAQKPVAPIESVAVKAVAAFGIKYRINQISRPTAGGMLFAHTTAVFELFDMFNKGSAPIATLRAAMGNSAVAYHVSKGNLESGKDVIYLSATGKTHFATRRGQQQDIDAYKDILTSGKADNRVVKNQAAIVAV